MTPDDLAAFVVSPADTLREALLFMQENHHGAAVVVDDTGEVLGTVTDIAIRRAVLDGADADTAVAGTLVAGSDMPVVEHGRLVDVRNAPAAGEAPGPVVIMAGGRGQRLRPHTDRVPKPLLKVGTSSILERLITSLAAAGLTDVHLSVNYKAEVFRERFDDGSAFGVHITYLRERKKLGTAGALSLLRQRPSAPVLVMNADMVTTLDFARLLDFHRAGSAAITVGAFEHRVRIPYGVLDLDGRHLRGVDEKPELRSLCSAGLYVLDPVVLRLVPVDTAFDMPELIDRALDDGLEVAAFPILEKFFDIGSPEELERVLIYFATGGEE